MIWDLEEIDFERAAQTIQCVSALPHQREKCCQWAQSCKDRLTAGQNAYVTFGVRIMLIPPGKHGYIVCIRENPSNDAKDNLWFVDEENCVISMQHVKSSPLYPGWKATAEFFTKLSLRMVYFDTYLSGMLLWPVPTPSESVDTLRASAGQVCTAPVIPGHTVLGVLLNFVLLYFLPPWRPHFFTKEPIFFNLAAGVGIRINSWPY